MPYTDHSFCWHGIVTPDLAAASRFYTDVLGWKAQDMSMDDAPMVLLDPGDGVPRLHLEAPTEDGIPAHWDSYFRVDDVDAATAKAVAAGGAQLVPPTTIPPGRFSVVTSPSGATVCLLREADPADADAPAGGIHWTELHSHELDADLAWLKACFGLTSAPMDMPDGDDYHVLMDGERQVGGAMASKTPDAPSAWLVWVAVDDVEDTAARVQASGGTLLGDTMRMPGVGTMRVAADPTGAVFGFIQPAQA